MSGRMNQLIPGAWRMLHKVRLVLVITALFAAAGAAAAPLTTVSIEGATVYSPAELFPAWRGALGRPPDREGIAGISAAIGDRYYEDGYARPVVRVDSSRAGEGILLVAVHEAVVSRVTIEGAPGRYRERLEEISGAVRDARPLRRDAIPRAVAEMRRIPGLAVTPSTRRDGAEPNAWELVLDVDFSPVSGSVRVNNRGTEQIGPHFMLVQLAFNDLGAGDRIGLLFSAAADTSEYRSGGLYYDRPAGGRGTRAMAMIFRSDSAPNESPVNLTDAYRRERASLSVTHPFGNEGSRSYVLSVKLEAEDLAIDRDGVQLRDDRLRVLETGLRMSWPAGAKTRLSSGILLRQGLDILGAGLRADDLPVDLRDFEFSVAHIQATSFTRFDAAWSLRADLLAQYTGNVLPDSERFKIGGERLGRGFEVAEIAGDRGLGAKLLLRRELGEGGKLGRPSAYAVYDVGAAWKEDASGRDSAASAGIGVALNGTRWSGYLEAVRPLTRADIEGKRSTALFAEIGCRF